MKSSRLLLALFLVLIPASRMIPALLNNAVFSTDSWPLIRLTQQLINNPSTRILSLNTHHAKWPQAALFSLIYTEITGIPTYTFYAFLGSPLIALILALMLYVLLGKIVSGPQRVPALLALQVYPSFALFTSAYLKEVYAYPLMLTLLLVVVATERVRWLGAFVTALALVLSHPLASLMTIASTATYTFIKLTKKMKLGNPRSLQPYKKIIGVTLLLSSLYLAHISIVGFPYVLTASDIIVLIAYSLFLYITYFALYANVQGFSALSIVVLLISISTYASLVEGITIGLNILLYGFPLPLLVLSFYKPKVEEEDVVASLLLPLAVGVLYTLTYATWLAGVTHRFLNYLAFPLALSLVAASRLKPRVALLLSLILITNSYVVLWRASTGSDPFLFYWRYTAMDLALRNYIEKYNAKRLVASVKYSYMLGEEIASGGLALPGMLRTCSLAGQALLVIGYGDLVYGVPFSTLHYFKPPADLFKCSSIVFNSMENYLLVK